MTLVFLLEEPSMKALLEGLLPRILPEGVGFRLIPHGGKSDLEQSIPRKLRAWRDPNARFVVVRDQDSGDCRAIKARLHQLCAEAGRPDTLIRIVCRELEAWYLGDLAAVDAAFGTRLASQQEKVKFRAPDQLGSPSKEIQSFIPEFGKTDAARRLGPLLHTENERSPSFKNFIRGVQRVAAPAVVA